MALKTADRAGNFPSANENAAIFSTPDKVAARGSPVGRIFFGVETFILFYFFLRGDSRRRRDVFFFSHSGL